MSAVRLLSTRFISGDVKIRAIGDFSRRTQVAKLARRCCRYCVSAGTFSLQDDFSLVDKTSNTSVVAPFRDQSHERLSHAYFSR